MLFIFAIDDMPKVTTKTLGFIYWTIPGEVRSINFSGQQLLNPTISGSGAFEPPFRRGKCTPLYEKEEVWDSQVLLTSTFCECFKVRIHVNNLTTFWKAKVIIRFLLDSPERSVLFW